MAHLIHECPGFWIKTLLSIVDFSVVLYGQSEQSIKINFDGAYDTWLCLLASGIVARNSKGVVLLSSSEIHQEIPSAFAAEALACRKAVQIGINMQWPQIIVEGDSLTVIKKCKTKE